MEKFIRYVGYADAPTKEQAQKHPAWAAIEDTDEAIQEALSKGYTAIGTTSFSHEIKDNGPDPIRKGDFVVDIDCKENPAKGIEITRRFVRKLIYKHGIPANFIQCWLSGGKGCHVAIPAIFLGAEHGDPYLPKIYKELLRIILKIVNIEAQPYFDTSMYCMGRGKLLRYENIKRKNGRYKVLVTIPELLQMPPQNLFDLTKQPREIPIQKTMNNIPNNWLKNMFLLSKWLISNQNKNADPSLLLESLFQCKFMAHCAHNAQLLSEPEWFAMIALLLPLGEMGKMLIHVLSAPYPEYSYDATEKKCLHARQYTF